MLIVGLFSWWYGKGWAGVARSTHHRLAALAEMFSVDILLRTLFSPWRRIITYPGAGLEARLRAFADNLVSRAVGFTVRLFALLAAAAAFVLLTAIGVIELITWPLVPLLALALLVKGAL
jgi:hypothetical protein